MLVHCVRSSVGVKTATLSPMKTDPSLYAFLGTDPEAFRVLSGGLTLRSCFKNVTSAGRARRAAAKNRSVQTST